MLTYLSFLVDGLRQLGRGLRDADFMVTGRAPNRNETTTSAFSHEFFAWPKNHQLVKMKFGEYVE